MCSVDFSLKRFSVVVLSWGCLLFGARCDDSSTDGETSELGVVGAPGVEVDTVTVTTTIAFNPDSNTDGNGGNTPSGNTEEPTPTSLDTGTLLSSPTSAVSGIKKITSLSQPSEVLSNSQTSSDKSKEPTRTSMSSSPPYPSASTLDTPGTLPSSAIGAIVGSISGAILLSAAIFLCFRAYKRKKQREEAHESIELDKPHEDKKWHPRRLIPSVIDTTGLRRPRDFDENDRRAARNARGGDANIGIATDGTDFVPTTPALESGRRPLTGLHARRISTTSPSASNRDSLYYKLLDEVKAGPAQPQLTSATAASSAVDWRDLQTPSTPLVGSFNFDFNRKPSGSGLVVTNPTPAARPEGTLGDRAWHRRKLSTTFQPPPSGPPSMPLPPTPPARTQRSIDSVMFSSMPGSTSKPKQQPVGKSGEEKMGGLALTGLTESTEALIQPRSLYTLDEPANISTIALGPSPAPTPPPKDDLLTLPSTRYEGSKDGGKGKGNDGKVSGGKDAQSPTLPPISQSGQEGVGSWSNMMHAVGVGDRDTVSKEEGREKQEQGQETTKRPESSSTIGTSILFPSEDESQDKT
ncbi:uncharacterized protein F4807DRAFT_379051 [Annulohypoxylon truncatum]|uniref:uncharacterized protein n=1 Tax=Annulohypoxylon truncatum TaxID=327061 RepID=UPI002007FE50|nr:uncharacterized protein F4807DRAFT_379051 [Annulohypoxylon truncatum]KAI1211851.1 hypothetical protein F4807DRAFT_379051 [Annulohypoxylon truncatum]